MLLDRSTKKVVLTEKGRSLYEEGSELVDRFEELKERLSESDQEPQGLLTIEQLIDQPAVHFEEGVELRSYIEGQLNFFHDRSGSSTKAHKTPGDWQIDQTLKTIPEDR